MIRDIHRPDSSFEPNPARLSLKEWWQVYRFQARQKGLLRGFFRSLKPHHQRRWSRAFIQNWIQSLSESFLEKNVRGLEIGSGEQTIAPVGCTVLSDAYAEHAGANSLATEFFPAEQIPYPDAHFDFILNEHVLEHLPNPIRALREWRRVLKPGGELFLFLPHPARTFDRNRVITPIEHMVEDFEQDSQSIEDQHWAEWNEQVIQAGLAPHYEGYSKDESLRGNLVHRHVFTPESARELLEQEGWLVQQVHDPVPDRMDSFVVVATYISK